MLFFQRGSFFIGDGLSTRFWEDPWLNHTPLMTQYPSLYSTVSHKNVTVAEILYQQPLNIGFRRELSGDRWIAWLQLVKRLMKAVAEPGAEQDGCYTVERAIRGLSIARKHRRDAVAWPCV
jgi:hypothetical protein